MADVDKLLGETIQKDLERDSGIKVTIESILGVCAGTHISISNLRLIDFRNDVVCVALCGAVWRYSRPDGIHVHQFTFTSFN